MNKKSIISIIIGFVIVVLLGLFITSLAATYEVGEAKYLGMGWPGDSLERWNGSESVDDPNAVNLMTDTNFDYFCANHSARFQNYGMAVLHYNIARAEITGDTINIVAGWTYGTLATEPYTETYTETASNSSKALTLLFSKIKDGEVTIDDVDVYGNKTGNKVTITRTRNNEKASGKMNYDTTAYDVGQVAMWMNLFDWRNNVANNMDSQGKSLWSSAANSIQSAQLENKWSNWESTGKVDHEVLTLAYERGKELYTEVINEVNSAVKNEYGIEETYYKDSSSEKMPETQQEVDEYTVLGPFRYNFAGNIQNGKPTLTFNDDTTSQEYIIGKYEGSTFTETNQIVSENQFYIKVKTTQLANVQYIHFNFQIEGISLYNTNTTLYFFVRQRNASANQTIVYFEQEEGYNKPFKDTYKLSKPVEVSLEKMDDSGNSLKAAGIKFQIRDEINAVVAYFETDASGNGIVTDANGNKTGATTVQLLTNKTYTLIETENNIYGYKKVSLNLGDIEISGAKIEQGTKGINFILDNNSESKVKIKAKNQKELANLEIEKLGKDETKLENVAFLIEIDSNKYLQLKDVQGKTLITIKGETTINSNNEATLSEYHVEYVSDKSAATQFITDANGKIVINNLEVNKSKTEKYSYTAHEISNANYGYGSKVNTSLKGTVTELKLNEINKIKITNAQALGNLSIKKYDDDNHNIVLPNVEFAIEISPSLEKTYAYLALYNQNGEIVPSIVGTATINSNNQATADGKEYEVRYYYSDKKYADLTDEEKANLTIFITNNEGVITINNLEVYSPKTGDKYTYKLIETKNANYGYTADLIEFGNIVLETDKTTYQELTNKSVYTKISGYVWIDKPSGKSNKYDGLYTSTDTSADTKLTDLYIIEGGKLIKNPKALTPVEIKLRDKTTGEIIKAEPDEFSNNGQYTFIDVEIEKLANYEVVFVYDGFYYTTAIYNLDENNGSKVKENETEREILNNKFETIQDNSEVVSVDGTINTVEYYKDGHTSTVSKLNFDTAISAATTINENEYNLKDKYYEIKANSSSVVDGINDVNMGIVLREQPKISINNDIYSVLIDFEGYKYNYEYNGRQDFYENKNGDNIGVKFEQEYTTQRYTRPVYASDIQAAQDLNKEIKVSITYRIRIANQSRTLAVMPKQIINYFDARYDIQAVGLGMDETTHTIINTIGYSEAQSVESNSAYKSTVIDFNQMIESSNESVKDLYITFDVQRDAILGLLNNKSTYHNATEILSYASYYSGETSKVDGEQYITDQTAAGKLYAGIDKASQPGNMELVLVDHPTEEGTQILDTTNYEDDTSSAPSLLLEASESRQISGTIFEDVATNTTDNQKLGDGIYSNGEKSIAGVKVELYNVNGDGKLISIATYSNGEQVTATTDESGNYTFGYYDETAKKYVGVLPGKYVIKYTYNNQSYIVGGNNINVNDYKSTIITSQVIKNAFEGENSRWYAIKEDNRYSDARDDISLRPEYNPDVNATTITNSTYNTQIAVNEMNAYTPVMDISIEFTPEDTTNALTFERLIKLENVDFGIVERPDIDITIQKEITGLEIIAQNGTAIVTKGDPSNPESSMQYVKTGLEGVVYAEIESDLLQGATLKLEYTISVVNNSDKDYLESEYYYYGTGGKNEITSRAKQVVDYLDSTMTLDANQDENVWKVVTAEDLYNDGNGFISEAAYNELKTGNYHMLTTNAFEEVGAGSEKSVKLYATKYLAASDSIREENKVEIIELSGLRTIKDSIPGDYVPAETPQSQDEDEMDFVITPPTGTTVNYVLYIIAATATFAILVLGIVVIKKKIIK